MCNMQAKMHFVESNTIVLVSEPSDLKPCPMFLVPESGSLKLFCHPLLHALCSKELNTVCFHIHTVAVFWQRVVHCLL